MANRQMINVVGVLRSLAGTVRSEDLSDSQLLEKFTLQNDESAFSILVQKHGAMVWGVCRRILGNGNDADDAFQATFMVLVRRASEVARYRSLSGWLHNVACRIALKARCSLARRHMAELGPMQEPSSWPEEDLAARHELSQVLDEELQCLPDKWRMPLVLCYLQGKTHEEAARDLGLARGSMARLISRAQEKLRARLAKRGVVATASVLGLCLAEVAATAAAPLPPTLARACRKSALAFFHGELTAATSKAAALASAVLGSGRIALLRKCLLVALGLGLAGGVSWAVLAPGAGRPEAPAIASVPAVRPIQQLPASRPGPRAEADLRADAVKAIDQASKQYAAVQQAARMTMDRARSRGAVTQGLDSKPEIRMPLSVAEQRLKTGDGMPAGSAAQAEQYRQALEMARLAQERADAARGIRIVFGKSQRGAVVDKIIQISGHLDALEKRAAGDGKEEAIRQELADARARLRLARAGLKKGDRLPKKSPARQEEYDRAGQLADGANVFTATITARLNDRTR